MPEMISVRIPASLKTALDEYAKDNHFLDTSEAVRDFLRKKITQKKDPYLAEIEKLRSSISENIKQEALRKSRESLILELKKLDKELRGDFK